jgi:AhpD family alkylhydroperoxidase
MDNTTRELIQLAASWAAGCSDCLETHWNALKSVPVSVRETFKNRSTWLAPSA